MSTTSNTIAFFENDYVEITVKEDTATLLVETKAETENMVDDDFKHFNNKYLDAFDAHNLSNLLIDTSVFGFSISIELQAWTAEHIIPGLDKRGCKKIAFVISPDLIPRLSIEQTMESQDEFMSYKYFDSQDDAMAWFAE